MNAPVHDAGGRALLRLDDHVLGDAMFAGPNDCYRLWLSRQWHGRRNPGGLPPNFALVIGHNPSTADVEKDDPTMNRVTDFAMEWGNDAFVMVNFADYRCTDKRGLRAPDVVPCSKGNFALIRSIAKEAEKIVCCWGNVHPKLISLPVGLEMSLRADGHKLFCWGTNIGGTPKHPLYLAAGTPLVEFKEIPF
jgi:hypothetical protein